MTAKRTRWIVTTLAALVASVVLMTGAIRGPAGDAAGGAIVAVSGPAATAPSRLRLATFNIHSGVGNDRRRDLKRTASLLKDCDLICLNEVRGDGPWWDAQATELGRLLQKRPLFAPSERRWWRESFGSAVLFNGTIHNWRRTQLHSAPGESFRNAMHLEAAFGNGRLHVLMTHITRGPDRQRQLEDVSTMFLKMPTPAALLGDLNSTADDPTLRQLLQTEGVEDPLARRDPRTRIDYILLRGVSWTDAGLVDNDASDHPMAWVEIVAP